MIKNLLALIHTYPLLKSLDFTAISAAKSKSASKVTIKGSEPPNSNTAFLRYLPAVAAITLPALVEPVNEVPYIYLLSKI